MERNIELTPAAGNNFQLDCCQRPMSIGLLKRRRAQLLAGLVLAAGGAGSHLEGQVTENRSNNRSSPNGWRLRKSGALLADFAFLLCLEVLSASPLMSLAKLVANPSL